MDALRPAEGWRPVHRAARPRHRKGRRAGCLMSRTYPATEPWEVPDPWHPIFAEALDPIVEPVVTRCACPAQRHEDAALFGPRVACELYWANHPTYGAAWQLQNLLDVKRQRARELREAG